MFINENACIYLILINKYILKGGKRNLFSSFFLFEQHALVSRVKKTARQPQKRNKIKLTQSYYFIVFFVVAQDSRRATPDSVT